MSPATTPSAEDVLSYLRTVDATTAQVIAHHFEVDTRDVSRVLLGLETVGDVVRIRGSSRLFWKAASV